MHDDDDDDGRDAHGRWKKGHCPNPRGRPRKQPELSQADAYFFKNTFVDAVVNGEKRRLTRHELLLLSMYDQAIKGKSPAVARKLLDRFDDVEMLVQQARDMIKQERKELLDRYYATGKLDMGRAEALAELIDLMHAGRRPRRPAIEEQRNTYENWRRGRPKSQALLAEEKRWEEEEAAERARLQATVEPAPPEANPRVLPRPQHQQPQDDED